MKFYSPNANFVNISTVKTILSLKAYINFGPHSQFLLSVLGEIRYKRRHRMPLTFSQHRKNRSSTDLFFLWGTLIVWLSFILLLLLYPKALGVPSVASTQQLLKLYSEAQDSKSHCAVRVMKHFCCFPANAGKAFYNVISFVRMPSDHGSVLH